MPGIIESISIQGDKAFKDAMRARKKAVVAAVNPACRDAANMVRDEAKRTSLFVDRSGALRAAIRTKLMAKKGTFIRYKAGPDGRKAPHGQLVGLGHKIVRGGKEVGEVEGRAFMEMAAKAVEEKAKARIAEGLKAAVK